MTVASVLRRLKRLKGQTEELRDELRGLLMAIEVIRKGEYSQIPVLMDALEGWVYRLGEYLTWLINLEDYVQS